MDNVSIFRQRKGSCDDEMCTDGNVMPSAAMIPCIDCLQVAIWMAFSGKGPPDGRPVVNLPVL